MEFRDKYVDKRLQLKWRVQPSNEVWIGNHLIRNQQSVDDVSTFMAAMYVCMCVYVYVCVRDSANKRRVCVCMCMKKQIKGEFLVKMDKNPLIIQVANAR